MKKLIALIVATVLLAIPAIKLLPNPTEPPHPSPEPAISQKVEAAPIAPVVESQTQEPVEVAQEPAPAVVEPAAPSDPTPTTDGMSENGYGSCVDEIVKYDWNHSVAIAVATAESSLVPGKLNDNPGTGDYSVGCFQVNLYGNNRYSRPTEDALKEAEINVRWAYNNYVANGHSFIGQWGVCRKIYCY